MSAATAVMAVMEHSGLKSGTLSEEKDMGDKNKRKVIIIPDNSLRMSLFLTPFHKASLMQLAGSQISSRLAAAFCRC
jgi:hypothetical protein